LADVPDAIKAAAMSPDASIKDKWAKERALFMKVAVIRSEYEKKQAQIDFSNWIDHYDWHLRQLHQICDEVAVPISYPRFVRLVYECTLTQFDSNQSRRIHPLV
jgi:hypothetical protein